MTNTVINGLDSNTVITSITTVNVVPSRNTGNIHITEVESNTLIASTQNSSNLIPTRLDAYVLAAGQQGPRGVQGPVGPSGATSFSILSPSPLSGHKAVTLSSGSPIYADKDTILHANKVIGITISANNAGDLANIQSIGELSGFSGLLVDMPVYLGNNGTLIQTIPTTGFIQQLGIATSTTTIYIQLYQSISQG